MKLKEYKCDEKNKMDEETKKMMLANEIRRSINENFEVINL